MLARLLAITRYPPAKVFHRKTKAFPPERRKNRARTSVRAGNNPEGQAGSKRAKTGHDGQNARYPPRRGFKIAFEPFPPAPRRAKVERGRIARASVGRMHGLCGEALALVERRREAGQAAFSGPRRRPSPINRSSFRADLRDGPKRAPAGGGPRSKWRPHPWRPAPPAYFASAAKNEAPVLFEIVNHF
jgi:hypothetical protein